MRDEPDAPMAWSTKDFSLYVSSRRLNGSLNA